LVAHSSGHPKLASVLELRKELALKYEKDVSSITPVIRYVTGAVFNLPDTDIAHLYCAPQGETGLPRMFGWRGALPIHDSET
jgi:hypothetical protein